MKNKETIDRIRLASLMRKHGLHKVRSTGEDKCARCWMADKDGCEELRKYCDGWIFIHTAGYVRTYGGGGEI